MKKVLLFLVLSVFFIYGCAPTVCNAPYIQVKVNCCLDSDSNKVTPT